MLNWLSLDSGPKPLACPLDSQRAANCKPFHHINNFKALDVVVEPYLKQNSDKRLDVRFPFNLAHNLCITLLTRLTLTYQTWLSAALITVFAGAGLTNAK